MFFKLDDPHVTITAVHSLAWDSKQGEIPKKKTHQLSYRMLGDADFYTDKGVSHADSGSLSFFPKGLDYSLKAGAERLIIIDFETNTPCASDLLIYGVRSKRFFENSFSDLLGVWTGREPGYYLKAKSIFFSILSRLQYELSTPEGDSVYRRLRPALELVSGRYSDPSLSVSDLAREIGTSETYLRRIFAKALGISPLEYINDLRFSRAGELLLSGFYTVEQVALECGFSDAKYFSTSFKKRFGVTPTEYKTKI